MKYRLHPSWLMVLSGLAIFLWAGLSWGIEVLWLRGASLGHGLFSTQDFPALLLGGATLAGLGLFTGRARVTYWTGGLDWRLALRGSVVVGLVLAFAVIAWAGRYWLFGDYSLSRDEQVAEFGAAALRHGGIGWPIPAEWLDYRRAIMPEFFSPFGADKVWTAAYLPLNSAVRALFGWLGDGNVAGPVFLIIGLLSLWRVALRLFPDRPDAVAVSVLMALSSTQLLVTGMTPYAMTGHFALNMLWLALVLRDDKAGHVGAALVALILTGLHQYHYPLPFLLPFLLWFALGRRWGPLVFHSAILVIAVVIWAKLWPTFLMDLYGPAADVRPSAGVADKMDSLFDRVLAKWHPLLHLSRFVAWNNMLLIPLALIALWRMDWRDALTGRTPLLPLGLGAFGMAVLAMDQGYGWGYRYLHGFIGSFALLAGYGWAALRRPGGETRAPVLLASLLVALMTGSLLMARAHEYVAPYAASHRAIMTADADVVLVDTRGGRFVTDVVRGHDGAPLGRPVVMNIGMLSAEELDRLCDRHSIAIFDKSLFLPIGIAGVAWDNEATAALRAQMEARGCGQVMALR
ncbi:MAG: MFS transporter [Sphingobium sp.]|nr:MFS transporter [Sphingobium sp.]